MTASDKIENILVIKHGALGDMVLATSPFEQIRKKHPNAHIVLLTSPPYDKLMSTSPYFDEIIPDDRPKFWHFSRMGKLIDNLRSYDWDMVYDLQTSRRSTSYYRLLKNSNGRKPNFCGIARGCSHFHDQDPTVHTTERHRDQLSVAGIEYTPKPDMSWLAEGADISKFDLAEKYMIIIAGGSAHRPEKRWSASGFIALGNHMIESDGLQPVLIGTNAEKDLVDEIEAGINAAHSGDNEGGAYSHIKALNLCNKTSFADLIALGLGAKIAVGNDTGPMHMVAATGRPSIVLFSHASNPDLCAPIGDNVRIIRKPDLQSLDFHEVLLEMMNLLGGED